MILILEGPDGAGKSTLAEKLRVWLSTHNGKMVHMVHHGPYADLQSEELCRTYFRAMAPAMTFNDNVIMDRSWLSEPIYGKVYRNGNNRVDTARRRMLERVALSRGAVVINCQPDFSACANAFIQRKGEEYLDSLDQLRQVYDEYDALPIQTHMSVIHYDYEHDHFDVLTDMILAHSVENKSTGGGTFKPGNILMLCDRGPRANIKRDSVIVPFINFLDNDGPSRMLASTLDREHISEQDLYWINTSTHDGIPTNPDFINLLKPSKIFALGNNAYAWALENSIKAVKLPPPLYHMQNFPHNQYYILGEGHGNTHNYN